MDKRTTELNAELKQAVLAFLNENFPPWTFGGNEPVVAAFVARLAVVFAAYRQGQQT